MNRVLHIFKESDLRCMHDGLSKIAKTRAGVNLSNLKKGEFVFFINTSFDKIKIFCPNQMVCYLRSPQGRLNAEALKHIPNTFDGSDFSYGKALEAYLKTKDIN